MSVRSRAAGRRVWMAVFCASLGFGWGYAGFTASAAEISGCEGGYRPASVIRDFALGREWMVFVSCAHPEMPRIAVERGLVPAWFARYRASSVGASPDLRPVGLSAGGLAPGEMALSVPAVEPGGRVRLWLRSPVAQVDLAGVALERGAEGAVIRVRVAPGGAVLRGTVRGAGSVELDVGDGMGFRGAGR